MREFAHFYNASAPTQSLSPVNTNERREDHCCPNWTATPGKSVKSMDPNPSLCLAELATWFGSELSPWPLWMDYSLFRTGARHTHSVRLSPHIAVLHDKYCPQICITPKSCVCTLLQGCGSGNDPVHLIYRADGNRSFRFQISPLIKIV